MFYSKYKKATSVLLLSFAITVSPLTQTVLPALSVQAHAEKVYVATEHGKKYHTSRDCRGLKNANSIQGITKDEAVHQGYEWCKLCGQNKTRPNRTGKGRILLK